MSTFNNDELEAPAWMTHEFFKDVLKKSEKDNSISIKNVQITPGTEKGDHYASVMFRAVVEYETDFSKINSKSLILKTMPEFDGLKKEMLGESFLFKTEISMYSKTIPKFEAELRRIGDNTILGAKLLYYSVEPRQCLIFEDIVPKGYKTLRDRDVNIEEVKAALLKLAKWHAVSYKLAAEGDTSVTDYRESFFNMKGVEELPYMTSGIQNFIKKLETIEEFKTCIPKLQSVEKDLIKRCINSYNFFRQNAAKGVFVLCHGDFHAKNMMFKTNDKGELEDVMLVDFQVCYFGSAALDLIYGIYMLFSEDMRANNRDELIYYYSSNFIDTLQKLDFQGELPKISDFYIEILHHKHCELFLLSTFLPLWYAFNKNNNKMEIDDLLSSNDLRLNQYDNADFLKEVRRLLPTMLYKGYLEKS